MESRRHKRLRVVSAASSSDAQALQTLVHTGYVSKSALVEIVQKIKNNPKVLQIATASRLDDADLAPFFGFP